MNRWARIPEPVLDEAFWRLKGAPMLPHVHVGSGTYLLNQGVPVFQRCASCLEWVPLAVEVRT